MLGGYVSQEAAARLYGVAIEGSEINASETNRLRSVRPEVKAFHRNEYVDVLD